MKQKKYIAIILLLLVFAQVISYGQSVAKTVELNFFGYPITIPFAQKIMILDGEQLTDNTILDFYKRLDTTSYEPLIAAVLAYKKANQLSDWLYYQLIRKTANAICPKKDNYIAYTLYKWFLMGKSGYDVTVRVISNNRLLFYIRSDENVYNIPSLTSSGKNYVCLNYHDFKEIDLTVEKAFNINIQLPGGVETFSYKLTKMPDFKSSNYLHKYIKFSYHNQDYTFKVLMNPEVKDIFMNYPVVDFEAYFNIPLSKETYSTLMPELQDAIKKMNQNQGIDYLMHFTRYAFSFEKDSDNFGKEKRLSPEETLLYDHSDCEDRAALFFYLVKEIYNLPMITLLYPEHVTIAIQLDKPIGKTIGYNGRQYSVCEPTPQREDLKIGQLPLALRKAAYDIGYEYIPANK